MTPTLTPSREAFQPSDKPQLVYARVINDIDTPVSAFIKAALGKPYAFLFESVQGGEQRGRFSFFGFDPDLIWRSYGDMAALSRDGNAYSAMSGKPLDALRRLIAECAFDLPDGLPPMTAGLFGYLGYDMIRHVEVLATPNPDPIGTPDAIMVRPRTVCIFDQVLQEIIVAALVPPGGGYDAAVARIEATITDLEGPTPAAPSSTAQIPDIEAQLGNRPTNICQARKSGAGLYSGGRRVSGRDRPASICPNGREPVRAIPRLAPDEPIALPLLSRL